MGDVRIYSTVEEQVVVDEHRVDVLETESRSPTRVGRQVSVQKRAVVAGDVGPLRLPLQGLIPVSRPLRFIQKVPSIRQLQ